MGNLVYSGARYWDATEAASIPASTLALTQSINDRLIGKFATTTARNSALSTLTSDQRRGALYWTDGVGFETHDGTNRKTVLVLGISYNRGTDQGTCDPSGIRKVQHGLGSPPVSVQVTMEGDNDRVRYLSPRIVTVTASEIWVKSLYTAPGAAPTENGNQYTSFHWVAFL